MWLKLKRLLRTIHIKSTRQVVYIRHLTTKDAMLLLLLALNRPLLFQQETKALMVASGKTWDKSLPPSLKTSKLGKIVRHLIL